MATVHHLAQPAEAPGRTERSRSAAILVGVFTALIIQAELIVAFVDIPLGVASHAILLCLAVGSATFRPDGAARRTLPVLALVPLLRILSLTMPVPALPPITWYGLVGLPLLVGGLLAVRAVDLPLREALLRLPTSTRVGWRVAASGIPLGVLAGAVGPARASAPGSTNELVVGLLLVFLFAGVLEELLFRGVLQRTLEEVHGRWGVVGANLLFTAAYLPSGSAPLVLVMAAAGALFGWSVLRTASVWPAAIGHGLLAVVGIVLWPALVP